MTLLQPRDQYDERQQPRKALEGRIEPEEPEQPALPSYPTALKLDPEQQKRLAEFISTRIDEVRKEMGLQADGTIFAKSWMGFRERYWMTYHNDLDWRKAQLGGIFAESNFTLGTNKRHVRYLAARIKKDLMGTMPFFAALTMQEDGNPELTKEVEAYLQDRIMLSNVPETLREAQKTALIINEAVIKTTYLKQESVFYGPLEVMVDAKGVPVKTPKGFYFEPNDDYIPDPAVENRRLLKKDPLFGFDGTEDWKAAKLPRVQQKLVHYDNVDSTVLEFRDFLCPLKFRHTWQADINVHLYEEDPEVLRGTLGSFEITQGYFSSRGKTGFKQPHEHQGEHEEEESTVLNPRHLFGEVYVRFDADGDGAPEEIFCQFDVEAETIVWCDYLGNHMRRRPFGVIPGVEREPGRWFGVGVFSMMEHPGLYEDAQFNRFNSMDGSSGNVLFRNRDAVDQWRAGQPFRVGSPEPLDCAPGYDAKNPPLFSVAIRPESAHGLELMNLARQAGELQFGAISSQAASAANLNQSKTATGTISGDRVADTLTEETEADQQAGMEMVLQQALEACLEHMDPVEMFYNPKTQQLKELNRDEIRTLPTKARLLLTRTRSTDMMVVNEKAEAIWMRYMRLTPREQYFGRPFYLKQLKGLEVDDAEQRCPEVTLEQVQAWEKAQQEAAAAAKEPPKPPSESISYKDAPESIRRQMEVQAGMKPARPEEIAATEAKEAAEKQQELDAKAKGGDKAPAKTK